MKQRMVENFSGDALDTDRWDYTLLNGTATGSMGDSINGGFNHTSTATGGTSESITTFGNVNQFNYLGAIFICVAKWSGDFPSTSMMQRGGFKNTNNSQFNAGDHAGFAKPTAAPYNFQAYTASNTGGVVGTDTGVSSTSADTFNVFKGELKTTSFDLTINGGTATTNTTNLPTVAVQPYIYSWAYQPTAGSMTASFNYYEAYNT
jgi:hypothetical protein